MACLAGTTPISQCPPARSDRGVWVLLVLLLALAAAVRVFYSAGRHSLWLDEAFCWRIAQFDWGDAVHRVGQDNHPPLYFLLLKAWIAAFGDSLWAMRSLSVLCGVAAVWAAYGLTRALLEAGWASRLGQPAGGHSPRSREAALCAAGLVAVSAAHVHWSTEVRMYSLGTALALASTWALVRAMSRTPPRWRDWSLYSFCALAFLYTHYYALFTLAAHAVFCIGAALCAKLRAGTAADRRRIAAPALGAWFLIFVGWLPWLPTFLYQRARAGREFWLPRVDLRQIGHAATELLAELDLYVPAAMGELLAAVVWVAVPLILVLRRDRAAVLVALCAAMPVAAGIALSALGGTHVFLGRYLLFAHVLWIVGVALLLANVADQVIRRACLAGVVVIGALGTWQSAAAIRPIVGRGTADVAGYLNVHRAGGEPVLVQSTNWLFASIYHAADRTSWHLLTEDGSVPHFLGSSALIEGEVVAPRDIRELLAPFPRIWTVNVPLGSENLPLPPGWTLRQQNWFGDFYGSWGVTVYEYTGPNFKPDRQARADRATR